MASIDNFRPEGSDHRPQTRAKVLYDSEGLHGMFNVQDRFVRCVRTNYFDDVWKESCVEFFIRPKGFAGYYNFEFNCGGAFLCSCIRNPQRVGPSEFKDFTRLPWKTGRQIQVKSTLPRVVDPEIIEPIEWSLQFFIPFSVFEGSIASARLSGQEWHGNFYKCGDELSHPHWASWSEVDEFNFHLPRCFGTLRFE